MTFFDRVSLLCNDKGISITRLASDIGLSSSTPNNWRTWPEDKKPRNGTIKSIADYFGVPLETLTGESEKVSVQTVQDNHGVIGTTHAPVTIINGSERKLTEQEIALLDLFGKMDEVQKALFISHAVEMLKK